MSMYWYGPALASKFFFILDMLIVLNNNLVKAL